MRRLNSSFSADVFLAFALVTLVLNFGSQVVSFPFQVALVLYGVFKADAKLLPGLYITLLDSSFFKFSSHAGILKFYIIIGMSVLNVFVIAAFFKVLIDMGRNLYDNRTIRFAPFWISMLIPALTITYMAYHDHVTSAWQVPMISILIPALYFWGISIGRTWRMGCEYVVKRFIVIFIIQCGFELVGLYSPGCQFQNHIIPIAFGVTLVYSRVSSIWKLIGCIGCAVGLCDMLFSKYVANMETYGLEGGAAVVSTFTRLFVVFIGIGMIVVILSKNAKLKLRAFPWTMLIACTVVFFYAIVRANTTNQNEVISKIADSKYTGLLGRFEGKLIGDRGVVWGAAFREELFASPLVFKRLKDFEVYDPISKQWNTRLPPHNQFLTLVCRQGWWLGLGMILFLWWMHTRMFWCAERMLQDRVTLVALVAPAAAIFVAVGLTGQHVFTQMWYASSMAGLTFPGILYGYVTAMKGNRF